jgi:hypothetical protein
MYCAPGRQKQNDGCFDRQALLRIIQDYNSKYPSKKIIYESNATDHQLWNLIRNGLSKSCGDHEWCWLDQGFLEKDDDIQNYYKPPKPETKTKWLSTTDINRVLKQYETIYFDFAFMGTVPIDFDQIIEEYAKMDMCTLYNGQGLQLQNGSKIYLDRLIRRFGFVFNLDPHTENGSHWVCMFMNLAVDEPFIAYFDSYGYCPPPAEISALMTRLKKQVLDCLGIELIKKCNMIRHQHKNTECGVYCLYFIYKCLRGQSFESIVEHIILDDDVNKYRDFFFRPTINYHD